MTSTSSVRLKSNVTALQTLTGTERKYGWKIQTLSHNEPKGKNTRQHFVVRDIHQDALDTRRRRQHYITKPLLQHTPQRKRAGQNKPNDPHPPAKATKGCMSCCSVTPKPLKIDRTRKNSIPPNYLATEMQDLCRKKPQNVDLPYDETTPMWQNSQHPNKTPHWRNSRVLLGATGIA